MTVRLYRGPAYGRSPGYYLRSSRGLLVPLGDDPVLPIAWLSDEPVMEIAKVLRGLVRHENDIRARDALGNASIEVGLTEIPGDDFAALVERGDEDSIGGSLGQLDVGNEVVLRIAASVPVRAEFTADDVTVIARATLPRGLTVAEVTFEDWITTARSVTIEARLSPRSRLTLHQITRAAQDLRTALAVTELDATGAWSLVAGGRADLLIGHRESQWLEVKRDAYRLDHPAARIEAAQDVARLANGGSSALLLCGLKAKNLPGGGERIVKVAPFPETAGQARRLRTILDAHVYPQVPGLRVAFAPLAGTTEGVLAVYVPRQAARLRPFLVHGAIAAGRTEGAFISIVARRDDDSVPITAAQIHPLLAGALAQDPEDQMHDRESQQPPAHTRDSSPPRYPPTQYADPLEFGPDTSALCFRAALVLRPAPSANFKIEPRHRKHLLAELNSGETIQWEQSTASWQSTTQAVFIRKLDRNEAQRLTVTKESMSDNILVIADEVLMNGQRADLRLDEVVDRLTRLVRLCSADLRGAVNLVTQRDSTRIAIEIHLEARGSDSNGRMLTIRDFADLTPLGVGRDRGPTHGASIWPPAWLNPGAEQSLVLEALRNNALDWGYLDPDPAFTQLGWQAG